MHSPKSIPLYTSTSHLKELYLDGGAMQDWVWNLTLALDHDTKNLIQQLLFKPFLFSATMVALALRRFFQNISLDNEFPQSNWLFCVQSFPCLVSFRCVLGVISLDNEVQLYFIRVLFSNWLFCIQKFPYLVNSQCMLNVLRSNLHTDSEHPPKTYRTRKELYAKWPTPYQNCIWIEEKL